MKESAGFYTFLQYFTVFDTLCLVEDCWIAENLVEEIFERAVVKRKLKFRPY